MPLVYSVIVALCSGALVGAALAVTFYLIRTGKDHEPLEDSYLKCDGGWHEAFLNGCCGGLDRYPQQPVNAYTSLSYLITGVFISQYINTGSSYVFMVSMCFLAFGSALYHGLSVKWAGHLDVLAIYWVFLGLLIFIMGRLWMSNAAMITLLMFLVAGVFAAFLRLIWKEVSIHWKVALILGPILGLNLWYVHREGVPNGCLWIGISFGLFLLAFLVWILDVKKRFWPSRWGHGIWHIFTGVEIPILFYVASR